MVKTKSIEINDFSNVLWRLGIIDTYFPLQDFTEMFSTEHQQFSIDLLGMNSIIEQKLSNHHIKYVRLIKNLLFINQMYLLLVLPHLDSPAIQKIIETYSSKYFLYIVLLNQSDYEKLLEIETIQLLDNVKPLQLHEIRQFNYENFMK